MLNNPMGILKCQAMAEKAFFIEETDNSYKLISLSISSPIAWINAHTYNLPKR